MSLAKAGGWPGNLSETLALQALGVRLLAPPVSPQPQPWGTVKGGLYSAQHMGVLCGIALFSNGQFLGNLKSWFGNKCV